MSKRNRPTTAAQAAHRRRRHDYRSAYNSPEGKAARGVAAKAAPGKAGPAAKPAAAPPIPAAKPAAAPPIPAAKPAAAAAPKPAAAPPPIPKS